ncbi:MAG TPA: nucleotide sugar dehydrogenase [bacterium]|nr:nucleotide sugar dehydrogenase [bacterium]
MDNARLRVAVIGLWHLGCVAAACLAKLGHAVVGVETSPRRLEELRAGRAPLREPGLDELLTAGLAAGTLRFSGDLEEAVREADVGYIAYDTPVNSEDEADPSIVREAAQRVGNGLPSGALLLVQSQVPVGSCELIRAALEAARPGQVLVACVPENIRLGQAIERYLTPDMLVVGARDGAAYETVDRVFARVDAPRVRTDFATAETIKHAINAFLATSISYVNEMANLAQLEGVDLDALLAALRLERRVGPHVPLTPGMGFAGGTLARDIKALQALGGRHGYVPHLFDAVLRVNDDQKTLPVRWLQQAYGALEGRRVGVLGLTYKVGTSTLRRSGAVEVIRRLVASGAAVAAADPQADPTEIADLPPFEFSRDPYLAAAGADALVVVTPWPQFEALDYARILSEMRHPFVLDMARMLDRRRLEALGFAYIGVGTGPVPRTAAP